MLLDPHPSQQYADLHDAVWWLHKEVTRAQAEVWGGWGCKSGTFCVWILLWVVSINGKFMTSNRQSENPLNRTLTQCASDDAESDFKVIFLNKIVLNLNKASFSFSLSRACRLWGSVTRLGDLLHFGQFFKACANNYFGQIAHIFRQFF